MPLPILDVPTYETKLPSTGQVIKYRPFLVKEHKVLLMMREADHNEITRIVVDVINNCTFNSLNTKKLAFFDLVYLFLELRKVSIGEYLDVIVNCECGTKIDTVGDLNKITVIKNDTHNNRIQLSRRISVDMRYPLLDEGLEAYTTTDVDNTLKLLSKCIEGIHDNNEYFDSADSSTKELIDFLEQLDTKQLNKLADFFNSMPKVYVPITTDCPNCKKHHDLKIEGLDNFFV